MKALPIPVEDLLFVRARDDFGTFLELTFTTLNPKVELARGWYLSAMLQALNEIADGSNRRLQITVPPRHLKSIMTTVAFSAWMMGRDPTCKIICASYGQELASSLSRDFRKVITSDWYKRVFPVTATSIDRETENEVRTKQGGFRFATAVGSAVTGYGADLIIIDDLLKAADASYPEARARAQRFVDESLFTRLNDKASGAVIAIQQRLHEDDVSAHLTAKGGYRHLNLPAIAVRDEIIPLTRGRTHVRRIGDVLNPDREPMSVLEEIRVGLGSRAFEAQYQQNPTPADGDILRWDRIQFHDDDPLDYRTRDGRRLLHKVVMSWDTADTVSPSADYSVGTVWGHDGTAWKLLDLIRVRLAYSDLLARIRAERRKWLADLIIVEEAGVGRAILDSLARDWRGQSEPEHHAPYCARLAASPRLGKAERFAAASDPLYSGKALLPRDAPWLDDLRREMMAFPNGRHDDQVDSVSQFLAWTVGRGGRQLLDPRRVDRTRTR
ncbi:phage terminase large subunit [Brevundimonas sp. AAP58]|uniref:phage terminase large subunit n=1 Tax=Brevundimonas sp. AAP58 TaxID=1523422 RepID=UPI0006B97721|nr:phage terminase large subunit [Brevundimonas sp. AAP58]